MSQLKMLFAGILVLALVAGLTLPILAADATGKIARVNPAKNEFTLTENFKDLTFQLEKGGRILINDSESKLADLRAGDEATVVYTKDGQKLIASIVRCRRK